MKCGLLDIELVIDSCPLQTNHCMWKNRINNKCSYTKDKLSIEDFALHVGIRILPSEKVRETIKERIKKEFEKSIK